MAEKMITLTKAFRVLLRAGYPQRPALADEMRLEASAEGVAVLEVANGSLAQSLGFQKGDVITQVNESKIERTRDLDRIAKTSSRLWRITIVRGGQSISVTFGG